MSTNEENTTTPAEADDLDFQALLDSILGDDVEPQFDESQSCVVYSDDVPVRITVEYQTGHAYEAAQVQGAMGSAISVLSFLASFPDDSVDAKLAELGVDRDTLNDHLFDLISTDHSLSLTESASAPVAHDPLALLREGADTDALLRA